MNVKICDEYIPESQTKGVYHYLCSFRTRYSLFMLIGRESLCVRMYIHVIYVVNGISCQNMMDIGQ
jgi:hypothetical protein